MIDTDSVHERGAATVHPVAPDATGLPDGVIAPSDSLVFNGHYEKVGDSLLISDGVGERFFAEHFFAPGSRQKLVAPNGSVLDWDVVAALAGATNPHVYAQTGATLAQNQIGRVESVTGTCSAIRNGQPVVLNVGDPVFKGDAVQTGARSALAISFIDGSAFNLAANARMVLNEMVYDSQSSSNSALLSIVQGSISFVAGQVAKSGDMRVDTPVATMGIRGTAVHVEIGSQNGQTKFAVLTEPDGRTGSFVLFSKSSGAVIGTVSSSGSYTVVQPTGLNTPPQITIEIKGLTDLAADRGIVNDIFQTYNAAQRFYQQVNPGANQRGDLDQNTGSKGAKGSGTFPGSFEADDLGVVGLSLFGLKQFSLTGVVETQPLGFEQITFYDPPPPSRTVVIFQGSRVFLDTNGNGIQDFGEQSVTTDANGNFQLAGATGTVIVQGGIDQTTGLPLAGEFRAPASFQTISPLSTVVSFIGGDVARAQTLVAQAFGLSGGPLLSAISPIEAGLSGNYAALTASSKIFNALAMITAALEGSGAVSNGIDGFRLVANALASLVESRPGTIVDLNDKATLVQLLNIVSAQVPGHLTAAVIDAVATVLGQIDSLLDTFISKATSSSDAVQIDGIISRVAEGDVIGAVAQAASDPAAIPSLLDNFSGDALYKYLLLQLGYPALGQGSIPDVIDGVTLEVAGLFSFVDKSTGDAHVVGTNLLSATLNDGTLTPAQIAAISKAISGSILQESSGGAGLAAVSLKFGADAIKFLGAGQVVTGTIQVVIVDSTGKFDTAVVPFKIIGSNDPAVIGNPTVSVVKQIAGATEHYDLTAAGTISISDPDQGQSLFSTTVVGAAGNVGQLTLNADGSYVYTVCDGAITSLGGGQSKVDTFTIKSVDGTTKQVSFTVLGANDSAVIGTPTVSSVTEDSGVVAGKLVAAGTISISDPDTGEAVFNTAVTGAAGNLGALVLNKDGSYTYSVDNSAVQYLGAGETKVDTFTVTSADGTQKQVSFTINGVNDPAQIGSPTAASLTENSGVNGAGNLTAVGTISIADADQNQAAFKTAVSAAAGNLGTLVLQPNGSYVYTVANSAVAYLGDGETKIDTFTVTSLDGTTKQVSFTIHGVNDSAIIGVPTATSVTEDTDVNASGKLTASGTISIFDIDQSQAAFSSTVVAAAGNLGTLSLAPNGSYTYSVDNGVVQYLGAGQIKVDTFTITSLDGTQSVVSFTINGLNDPAVIGGPSFATVNEDGATDGAGLLTAVGSIPISDADQGQGSFVPGTLTQGNLGKLTLGANGAYTYAVSAALVQYLAAGQTRIEDFVVTSLDGTQKHVDFTIVGANDAPVLKADATTLSGLVNERAATTGSSTADAVTGSIAFTDLDLTDTHQVTITGVSTSGTKTGLPSDPSSLLAWMKLGPFTDSTGGATGNVGWTFSAPDKAFDYLAAGESATLTYAVQVTDGHGGVINQNVTVTLQGANDAPVIQPSSVLTKEIDVAHTISAVGESYLTSGPTLIGNLGNASGTGTSGFGEHELFLAGDKSSGPIDITSIFGSKGIDYFGHYYTSIYINENGNITFSGPNGGYSPPKGDLITTDMIAPFWGNVDLSTGGHIYYDMDSANGVMTITWYQVGYHNQTSGGTNSFQLQLVDEGNGNFDMVFRYQDINWTNNSGSGNDDTNGTGALAGYTYHTNSGYTTYVIADRSDQSALLQLDTTPGNTSITGLDVFKVAPNPIQNYLASGTLDFVDPDLSDVHTGTFTAANGTLGQLQLVKVSDTTGTGTGGEFKWVYTADATLVSDFFRATSTTDKLETFDVVIDDGHQQLHQTVTVHLEYGAMA